MWDFADLTAASHSSLKWGAERGMNRHSIPSPASAPATNFQLHSTSRGIARSSASARWNVPVACRSNPVYIATCPVSGSLLLRSPGSTSRVGRRIWRWQKGLISWMATDSLAIQGPGTETCPCQDPKQCRGLWQVDCRQSAFTVVAVGRLQEDHPPTVDGLKPISSAGIHLRPAILLVGREDIANKGGWHESPSCSLCTNAWILPEYSLKVEILAANSDLTKHLFNIGCYDKSMCPPPQKEYQQICL